MTSTEAEAILTGGVDVHAHWFPREFLDTARRVLTEFGGSSSLDQLVNDQRITTAPEFCELDDERLRMMDEAGISTQILSYSSPHPYHPAVAARVMLTKAWNDATASACEASTGHFRFFATLPLPFLDVALEEIERARVLPGFAGFGIPTHIDGLAIDGRDFAPLFDRINEISSVVFLHPDGFCVRGALSDYAMEWTLGAPFEDTIAALRLVGSKTIERCPTIRFVIPHLGGTLPFLLSRIERHWAARGVDGGVSPIEALRKIYVDTAQSTPAMLAMAAASLGVSQLVFGTDFPYMNRSDFTSPARDLLVLGNSNAHAAFQAANLSL
jgi:aminocarboxymuconate-semialdehyde decarboxylase